MTHHKLKATFEGKRLQMRGGGISGLRLHRRGGGHGVSEYQEVEWGKGTQTTDEGRGTRGLRLQRGGDKGVPTT